MTTYTPTKDAAEPAAKTKTRTKISLKRETRPYINPYLGGILLGLVLFSAFFFTGSGLGASGGMNRLLVLVEDTLVPGHVDRTPYLLAMAGGLVLGAVCLVLGLQGWPVQRLWLYLLGAALLLLVGLELSVFWVIMRVLEELSEREGHVSRDMGGAS